MALDYEKAFKALEIELTNGTKWAKKQNEEYEEKYYYDKTQENYARWWYSNGYAVAYEYLLNYMAGVKVNPHLQKEA